MAVASQVTFFPRTSTNEDHFQNWECCICKESDPALLGGTVAQKVDSVYHIYHRDCILKLCRYSPLYPLSPLTRKRLDLAPILTAKQRKRYVVTTPLSHHLKTLALCVAHSSSCKTIFGMLLTATGISYSVYPLMGSGLLLLEHGTTPIDEFLQSKARRSREKAIEAFRQVARIRETGANKNSIHQAEQMAAVKTSAAERMELISVFFSASKNIIYYAGAYVSIFWAIGKSSPA